MTDQNGSRKSGGQSPGNLPVPHKGKDLPTFLIEGEIVRPEQLARAKGLQASGENLGQTLVRIGALAESDLLTFLSSHYGVPSIDLDDPEISREILIQIPKEFAQRHMAIPLKTDGKRMTVAMADPGDFATIQDFRFRSSMEIDVVVASDTAIQRAIDLNYDPSTGDAQAAVIDWEQEQDAAFAPTGADSDMSLQDLRKATEEAPIVRMANLLLINAVRSGASDIHVEPYEKFCRVRYRIDGILHTITQPPVTAYKALVSRLKILAELDIAEHRLPQDGRIKMVFEDEDKEKEVDFRVSTTPVAFGEKVVLRVLDKSVLSLRLDAMGFADDQLLLLRRAIRQPFGMVLVTGPTGSGKSTTLYSAISELNTSDDKNISTVEDPIEVLIPGVNQVAINDTIKLTFANALRAFLRQDPNILMVGEIRDFETAEIAFRAALTGHLVLSTLHTNDAVATIVRLTEIGIEPHLMTSLLLICAQRLVRKVCKRCKWAVDVPIATLQAAGFTDEEASVVKVMEGKGCRHCRQSGYRGRIGVHEVLPFTPALKKLVLDRATSADIQKFAIESGMRTLRRSGLDKVKAGITTLAEIMRLTQEE